MRSFPLITLAAGLLAVNGSRAIDPPWRAKAAVVDPERFARLVWCVADEIQKHHVNPPSRPELVKSLLKAAGMKLPEDFDGRLAKLTSAGEIAATLRQISTEKTEPRQPPRPRAEFELLKAALEKTVKGVFLIPADQHKLHEQTSNNRYVGTGIQIGIHRAEKLPEIIFCFPGGPARRAGVRAGDLIVQVDNDKVPQENTIQRTVELLRGDEGTEVTMHVRRPGSPETRSLKMVRSVIPFSTVEGHRRRGEEDWDYHADAKGLVAYIRMHDIMVSTPHELKQVERRLQREGFRALVLDLRFCRGERAHDALLVADALLEGGVLWRERDALGRVTEHRADPDCLFRGWPLAVLVKSRQLSNGAEFRGENGGELLAAALQDNGRAMIVGESTQGDRYIYDYISLPQNQGAIRLPVRVVERARASGKSAGGEDQTTTVRPDYPVAMTKEQVQRWTEWRRAEELSKPTGGQVPEDPPLAKAVELLRAKLQSSQQAEP